MHINNMIEIRKKRETSIKMLFINFFSLDNTMFFLFLLNYFLLLELKLFLLFQTFSYREIK